MRKNSPLEHDIAEGLEGLLAEMRAAIAGIERPPALVEAEGLLMDARDRRADLWLEFQRRVSDVSSGRVARGTAADTTIHDARAAVDEQDKWVRARQSAVDALRDKYADELAQQLGRYRRVAAVAAHAAALIIAETNSAAAREHRKLEPALEYSVALHTLVSDAHRAQAAKAAKDEAAFDRAIAANARPLRPSASEAPASGKVSRSEALGMPALMPDRGFRVEQKGKKMPAMSAEPLVPGRITPAGFREAALSIFGSRK